MCFAQFPTEKDVFSATKPKLKCNLSQITSEEQDLLKDFAFWVEGVAQGLIGVVGILGNLLAAKIFISGSNSNKFKTVFFRLLLTLLVVQTCYVGLSLITFLGLYKLNPVFNQIFANGLYPLPSLANTTSTILTVTVAW